MESRIRNAAATREKILASARARFLLESYDTVGLRDIAGDAGVDVALVGRYFGSKEELFKEVLRAGRGALVTPGTRLADLPSYLASVVTRESGPDPEEVDSLLIILRSVSSPKAAAAVRDAVRADVLEPIAQMLSGEDAELRASFTLSILMGTTILRTIMAVEPLCACDKGEVRTKLAALLASALAS
jgi:AcrR family transcriptional regulator